MSEHALQLHVDDATGPAVAGEAQAFAFVRNLARELSQGIVELPAYPDVAVRAREVLGDPEVTNERIAKIIGTDAGLAARVLALANSAALARGGKTVTDLRLAVTRVGHDNVRTAALAYALTQIRASSSLQHIRGELARLWESSTLVAALARVMAIHTRAANADEALLAGLLHNVGAVYVLARTPKDSTLLLDPATRDAVLIDWQASIGKAVAENWGLPERVTEAIGEQESIHRHEPGPRDLIDVLQVAVRAAGAYGQNAPSLPLVADLPAFQRLGLDTDLWAGILADGDAEIVDLRSALGN
jgi:HD-like signal output (HDOD) protein